MTTSRNKLVAAVAAGLTATAIGGVVAVAHAQPSPPPLADDCRRHA